MPKRDLESEILAKLYVSWFEGRGADTPNLEHIVGGETFTGAELEAAVRRLERGLFIQRRGPHAMELLIAGVNRAEHEGAAPAEMVAQSRSERTRLMLALAEAYEQNPGNGDRHYSHLRDLGIDERRVLDHFDFFERAGVAEATYIGAVEITEAGFEAVQAYRSRQELIDEFDRIKSLSPSARGLALQRHLVRVIRGQTGNSENSRTVVEGSFMAGKNEDTDVLIRHSGVYYNLESKWEQEAIGPGVVEKLYAKLAKRAELRGIVASMSGFTSNVEATVLEHMGSRSILLFGRQSIESLIRSETTFEELVDVKYHALISRKTVLEE